MEHPGFFTRVGPHDVATIAKHVGAEVGDDPSAPTSISDVRALDDAGPQHLTFFDNRKYLAKLKETSAGACLVRSNDVQHLPDGVAPLVTNTPYHAYAKALLLFYPDAERSLTFFDPQARPHSDPISPNATLEEGVIVEPGARIGDGAVIGAGTRIASGAFVGYRVHIGRDCYVGPNASVTHALIGDRVVIHQGVQIGQDGFGFAMGPTGHLRVPQVGRVIIQDNVDIGANTCIDRGALNDTIIGEGTKIDNLVQIAHNVVIGRHCVIVAQVGISGSAVLEDFVAMGGQSATVGHNRIGAGAQIAAQSGVTSEVPAGGAYGGSPAVPLKDFARQVATLKKFAKPKKSKN